MRSCMSWSEISTSESKWIYLELDSPLNTVWSVILLYDSGRMLSEAFARQLSRDDVVSSISEISWLLVGVWIWRRWFWNLRFDSWRCFKHLRCLWSPLTTSCEYVRYFGIVRTMPTYSIRHLGIWSGSLLCDLCLCDLLLTFGYCGERTTLALWLLMTGY